MLKGLSVALVVRNEERNLFAALHSLLPIESLSFPWEILVVDNGSEDQTRAEYRRFRELHPEITLRWISHGENHLGKARACAVTQAAYSVVSFLDGDCRAGEGWMKQGFFSLERMVAVDEKTLAVGGGNSSPGQEPFHRALDMAFSSRLSSLGSVQSWSPASSGRVHHLSTCNVFYRREALLAAGNFSSQFRDVCEDLELSRRAVGSGWHLYFLPSLKVIHDQNTGWGNWCRKMFRYGRGQLQVAARHPSHLFGLKAVPLLGILFLVSIAVKDPKAGLGMILVLVTLLAALSLWISGSRGEWKHWSRVFALYLTTSVFYALGECWGLLQLVPSQEGEMAKRKRQRARFFPNHLHHWAPHLPLRYR